MSSFWCPLFLLEEGNIAKFALLMGLVQAVAEQKRHPAAAAFGLTLLVPKEEFMGSLEEEEEEKKKSFYVW